MPQTLYRRPLPTSAVPFSSGEGRQLFSEALASGGLDGYFPLAEQFHTQADPAFCGLGSLVMALNALGIDPGRLWKGPWRWFAEDLLDCCVPLDQVRARGMNLDELACLARCNGAEVDLSRADCVPLEGFRAALRAAASGQVVIVAAYDRSELGQTGAGHFSPIGGYHAARDLALLLDVARFKYPPHWLSAEALWRAMQPLDAETGRARGWLALGRRRHDSGLGFSVRCEGESWHALLGRLSELLAQLDTIDDLTILARATLPLARHLELRTATTAVHAQLLERTQAAIRSVAAFAQIEGAVGAANALPVTILLLALSDRLPPAQRSALAWEASEDLQLALDEELAHLRAQLSALCTYQQQTESALGSS